MSMKSILVAIEDARGQEPLFETALQAARLFGSTLHGFFVHPIRTSVVAGGSEGVVAASLDLMQHYERQGTERARQARSAFLDFMRAQAVVTGSDYRAPDQASAHWFEDSPQGEDVLGEVGRIFDVIAIARPVRSIGAPALETALFESGRPLMIAPPTRMPSLGRRAVIAWNGSTESARTVGFAMPFLERSQEVVVLTIEGGTVPGPAGAQLAQQLQRNGINARSVEKPAQGRTIGEAILAETRQLEADLLVKGAYTQSRLRQMIFGGATSHILAAAELPVFMSH